MAKISDKIAEQIEGSLEQIAKPKRHRRTKAEMQAAREQEAEEKEEQQKEEKDLLKCNSDSHIIAIVKKWDQEKDDENQLPTRIEIPDNILIGDYDSETISNYISDTVGYCHYGFQLKWPDHHNTLEELCQWDIEKAHLGEKPDPDFDYRLFYSKGDRIYLVRDYEKTKTKEISYLTLRTIYPRMMVGYIDKAGCTCIGYDDKDNIFINKKDAMDYFNSINEEESDDLVDGVIENVKDDVDSEEY